MPRDSAPSGRRRRGATRRLRAGLRRHGVVPRPRELARVLRVADLHFSPGNALELYGDGTAGLAAMLEAVEGARRRVHLESYILRSDATGRRFLDVLTQRARAGVEVRVLYDSLGSRSLDPASLDPLRAAGGDAVAFNPVTRLYPHWAPRRRDHRKILVIDGQVAFTGGLNIGDEYSHGIAYDGGPARPWLDAHVRVTGPAVPVLEAVFLESWFRADGPDRPWLGGSDPATSAGDATVAVLPDGPTYHRRRVRDFLVEALARARSRARFATPYFVPGRRLREALAGAAARGVSVEVLIAGYSDHPALRWAARALAPRLLARGVQIHEFEPAMMHAKVAVFDETWAVLGTSNLDRQSLQHSYEVNLVVEGGGFPERLSALLDRQLAESRPLSERDLALRSPFARLRDRISAFLLSRW